MWILNTFKCFEKLIGPRAANFRFDTAEKELSEVDISDGRGFPERLSRLLVAAVFITVNRGDPLGPRHRDQAGPGQGGGRRHNGRSAKFRQNGARFRLYRHRFLQVNMRFAAFFKIYKII